MLSELEPVFEHYTNTCRPLKVLELENFASWGGPMYYRVVAEENGIFCLRRWPKGQPSRQHLEFMQAVLWASDCEGAYWLPLPRETDDGKGYVEHDGSFWELVPWCSGSKIPFDRAITPGQLQSLVESLAKFHDVINQFPHPNPPRGLSPRATARNRQWQNWVREKLARLDVALYNPMLLHIASLPPHSGFRESDVNAVRDELIELAKLFLRSVVDRAGRLISILVRASRIAVPHQPVLQSLYRRHLLFSDQSRQINGLIDCSEMGVDTPAIDMAMVLTHLSPWESAETIQALAQYRKIRDIPDNEYYLMVALYHAETVMYPLDRLAMLFLPNEPGYLAAPNVAQAALVRDELRWGLEQIANFQKDENAWSEQQP
jgi:Putative homoserine kinase type II (protein kinase fold)